MEPFQYCLYNAGDKKVAAACSVTGVGENIIRAALAKATCQTILKASEDLGQACRDILQSEILDNPPPVSNP